jgi:hypothetical protein
MYWKNGKPFVEISTGRNGTSITGSGDVPWFWPTGISNQ